MGAHIISVENLRQMNEFAKNICCSKRKRLIKNIPDINQVSSDDFIDKVNRPANSYLDCSKIFLNFNINQPSWKSDLESYLDDLSEAGIEPA